MTRKDYVLIAAILAGEKPIPAVAGMSYADMGHWERGAYDSWNTTVLAFAHQLGRVGTSFNRSKFLTACGVSA